MEFKQEYRSISYSVDGDKQTNESDEFQTQKEEYVQHAVKVNFSAIHPLVPYSYSNSESVNSGLVVCRSRPQQERSFSTKFKNDSIPEAKDSIPDYFTPKMSEICFNDCYDPPDFLPMGNRGGEDEVPSHLISQFKFEVPNITLDSNNAVSSDSSSSESEYQEESVNDVEAPKITVGLSTSTKNHRVYDKRNYCLFCEKMFSKLPEHLEFKHGDEKDVSRFLSLKKGSNERKVIIKGIRNKGNFLLNKKILTKRQGKIIACRRPKKDDDANQYLPCEYCLGFYSKKFLARHCNRCPLRTTIVSLGRVNAVRRSSFLLMTPSQFSERLTDILSSMKNDKLTLIARNDNLIRKFGEMLCEKHRDHNHLNYDISQKMRELSRLVLALQSEDESFSNLSIALTPQNFKFVVKCVKIVCNLNNLSKQIKPTLALKLGYSIQKCINIMKSEAIINRDEGLCKSCDDFMTLYDTLWSTEITKRATEAMDKAKWYKQSMIPIASDVAKINFYIQKQEKYLYKQILSNSATTENFKAMTRILLVHTITFNRKRVGEVERLERSVYLQRVQDVRQGEIEESLSKCEKILLNNLTLIHIRGKQGRKVPLLLTPKMVKYIDLLLMKRSLFGVPNSNMYIFARCGCDSHYSGSEVLREVSNNCGAEEPSCLTSTQLRKHIATISQVLNLKNNDLELLAKHLGHSINVHKEFYRLPSNTLELAKVSKLLLKFESGVIKPNQNLDNINLELDEDEFIDQTDEDEAIDQQEEDIDQPQGDVDQPDEGTGNAPRAIIVKINQMDKEETISEEEEEESQSECEEKICSTKERNTYIRPKNSGKVPNKKRKHSNRREIWSMEENKVVETFFERHILSGKVPNKMECEECKSQYPILQRRDWVTVKSKIHNIIVSNKRKLNQKETKHSQ